MRKNIQILLISSLLLSVFSCNEVKAEKLQVSEPVTEENSDKNGEDIEKKWDEAKLSTKKAWQQSKEAGKDIWEASKESSLELLSDSKEASKNILNDVKEKSSEVWKKSNENLQKLLDDNENEKDNKEAPEINPDDII